MQRMDTHRMPDARSERFGRLVGAILITEGVLVAILRFLSLVYVVASEAYNADRFRTPLSHFLPSVLISGVVAFVLVWAGSFLRREPSGAWAEVGPAARVALVVAGLLNVAAVAAAVDGLVRSPASVEGALTWIAIAVASVVVIVGLIRDVMRSRATSASGTAG
jgi:hypothetical protein